MFAFLFYFTLFLHQSLLQMKLTLFRDPLHLSFSRRLSTCVHISCSFRDLPSQIIALYQSSPSVFLLKKAFVCKSLPFVCFLLYIDGSCSAADCLAISCQLRLNRQKMVHNYHEKYVLNRRKFSRLNTSPFR